MHFISIRNRILCFPSASRHWTNAHAHWIKGSNLLSFGAPHWTNDDDDGWQYDRMRLCGAACRSVSSSENSSEKKSSENRIYWERDRERARECESKTALNLYSKVFLSAFFSTSSSFTLLLFVCCCADNGHIHYYTYLGVCSTCNFSAIIISIFYSCVFIFMAWTRARVNIADAATRACSFFLYVRGVFFFTPFAFAFAIRPGCADTMLICRICMAQALVCSSVAQFI